MDMLASFFAGSYAVYNRMNSQRRQEIYSNFNCYPTQIPQLIPLQIVSNAQIPSTSDQTSVERKTQQDPMRKPKPDQMPANNKDRMKFSIDSILSEKTSNDETATASKITDINVMDSDETDGEDDKLPWLQCTRYQPPKLPSKSYTILLSKSLIEENLNMMLSLVEILQEF